MALSESCVAGKGLSESYVAGKGLNESYVAGKGLSESYVAGKGIHLDLESQTFLRSQTLVTRSREYDDFLEGLW